MNIPLSREQVDQYMRKAYAEAAKSPDPSNQNGALILNRVSPESEELRVVGQGYNKFPDGIDVSPKRLQDRDTKLRYMVHAELAAIIDAARKNGQTSGGLMVCPWAACVDKCAPAIIQAHIACLVVHESRMAMTPERWKQDVNYGLGMLMEAGVQVQFHPGPIELLRPVMINGELKNTIG